MYIDSLIDLFDNPEKKEGYRLNYVQALFNKGDILIRENKFNEAYKYYYQGKLFADRELDACSRGDFSYRLGMVMYNEGHFSQALVNFKNSLYETNKCSFSFNKFCLSQELYDNAGLCYGELDLLDSALAYYKKGLDYINKEGQRFRGTILTWMLRGG